MNMNQFARAGALAMSLAFLTACGGSDNNDNQESFDPNLPALDHDAAAAANAAFVSFSTPTESGDPNTVTADLRYGVVEAGSVQECLDYAVLGVAALGKGTSSNVTCFNTAVSNEPVAAFSCEEQSRDEKGITIRCEREGTNPKTFTVAPR